MAQTWHMVLTQTRTSAYKCVFVNRPAVGLELATLSTIPIGLKHAKNTN